MLVHMQPREVAGLQALAMKHGGSLTINPETGLPEAGFLGDVLGAVAPIALGAWLGPAGAGLGGGLFESALGAGLAVGAGAWALTGDPMQGLKWGLGAGGGAGLGSNIANYGSTLPGSGTNLASDLATGAKTALSNPSDYASYLKSVGKSPWTDALTLGAPLFTAATTSPDQYKIPTFGNTASPYEGPYTPPPRTVSYPTAPQRQQLGSAEWQYFNPVSSVPGYMPNTGYAAGGSVFESADPDSNPGLDAFQARNTYGLGGLAATTMPGMKRGGYLDGPGDGMSDSIHATIEDKQPARLADGEFVVPADVVSHLGNGSTKAGAKRLYAMMDKVRQARTGTTKQGKQIKPEKYIPA